MTDEQQDILKALPTRLRDARKTQGLSLDAVANLSGVSRSMVSQIERGESSPTISTLWNLTRALRVDFAGLLEGGEQGDAIDVLSAQDVPSIDNIGNGCRIMILSPPEAAGGHEVYDIRLSDQGVLQSQPHARGSVEHLTVLSGQVTVTSGTATSLVSEGDTARYSADVAHSVSAHGGAARVFLIVKYGEDTK